MTRPGRARRATGRRAVADSGDDDEEEETETTRTQPGTRRSTRSRRMSGKSSNQLSIKGKKSADADSEDQQESSSDEDSKGKARPSRRSKRKRTPPPSDDEGKRSQDTSETDEKDEAEEEQQSSEPDGPPRKPLSKIFTRPRRSTRKKKSRTTRRPKPSSESDMEDQKSLDTDDMDTGEDEDEEGAPRSKSSRTRRSTRAKRRRSLTPSLPESESKSLEEPKQESPFASVDEAPEKPEAVSVEASKPRRSKRVKTPIPFSSARTVPSKTEGTDEEVSKSRPRDQKVSSAEANSTETVSLSPSSRPGDNPGTVEEEIIGEHSAVTPLRTGDEKTTANIASISTLSSDKSKEVTSRSHEEKDETAKLTCSPTPSENKEKGDVSKAASFSLEALASACMSRFTADLGARKQREASTQLSTREGDSELAEKAAGASENDTRTEASSEIASHGALSSTLPPLHSGIEDLDGRIKEFGTVDAPAAVNSAVARVEGTTSPRYDDGVRKGMVTDKRIDGKASASIKLDDANNTTGDRSQGLPQMNDVGEGVEKSDGTPDFEPSSKLRDARAQEKAQAAETITKDRLPAEELRSLTQSKSVIEKGPKNQAANNSTQRQHRSELKKELGRVGRSPVQGSVLSESSAADINVSEVSRLDAQESAAPQVVDAAGHSQTPDDSSDTEKEKRTGEKNIPGDIEQSENGVSKASSSVESIRIDPSVDAAMKSESFQQQKAVLPSTDAYATTTNRGELSVNNIVVSGNNDQASRVEADETLSSQSMVSTECVVEQGAVMMKKRDGDGGKGGLEMELDPLLAQHSLEEVCNPTTDIGGVSKTDKERTCDVEGNEIQDENRAKELSRSTPSFAPEFLKQLVGLPSLERLKMRVFLTGARVHRGRGAERRYADYWGALSHFVAARLHGGEESNLPLGNARDAFDSFLTTARLRKLHNQMILAIMQRCMQPVVLDTDLQQHVPARWRNRAKRHQTQAKKTLRFEAITGDEAGVLVRPKLRATHETSSVKGVSTRPFAKPAVVGMVDRLPGGFPARDVEVSVSSDLSSHLPGALTVDRLVKEMCQTQGIGVASNAVWLLVIAVREYASSVLRSSISTVDAICSDQILQPQSSASHILFTGKGGQKKSSARKTARAETGGLESATILNPLDSSKNAESRRDEEKRCITSMDIANGLGCIPIGIGASLGGSASRLSYERCVAASFPTGIVNTTFDTVSNYLSTEIKGAALARKERKEGTSSAVLQDGADSSSSLTAMFPAKHNVSMPDPKKVNARRSSGGLGRGAKNLAALRARAVTNSSDAVIEGAASPSGKCDTSDSPAKPSSIENGDAGRLGRGSGVKDLAAIIKGRVEIAEAGDASQTAASGDSMTTLPGQSTESQVDSGEGAGAPSEKGGKQLTLLRMAEERRKIVGGVASTGLKTKELATDQDNLTRAVESNVTSSRSETAVNLAASSEIMASSPERVPTTTDGIEQVKDSIVAREGKASSKSHELSSCASSAIEPDGAEGTLRIQQPAAKTDESTRPVSLSFVEPCQVADSTPPSSSESGKETDGLPELKSQAAPAASVGSSTEPEQPNLFSEQDTAKVSDLSASESAVPANETNNAAAAAAVLPRPVQVPGNADGGS